MHRVTLRSAALLGLAVLAGCNRAVPPPAARPVQATEQDKKDLVEFMKACTGDLPRVERGRLPK
ncbi:MAG: hypothetical protein WD847_04395 [Pirellulales bacterium]